MVKPVQLENFKKLKWRSQNVKTWVGNGAIQMVIDVGREQEGDHKKAETEEHE